MRSFFATLRQLVLPAGAQPSQPRTVLGPDPTPEMVAWGLLNGVVFANAVVYYYSATQYVWESIGTFGGQVAKFEGTYDPTNGIYVVSRTFLLGAAGYPNVAVRISSPVLNTFPLAWNFFQTDVLIDVGSRLIIGPGSDFLIDTVSQGRGLVNIATSVGNSAAVAAETVYLTCTNTVFKNDRCYKLTLNYHCRGAGGATSFIMRIRRINLAGGAYINDMSGPFQAAYSDDSSGTFVRYLRNTTGADITQTLVWTWAPTGGGTAQMIGAAGIVGAFVIEDCGDATDYPNINTVV